MPGPARHRHRAGRGAGAPRRVPRPAGPDARAHRVDGLGGAGDWVSREYLESTFALRMQQLAGRPDDPAVLRAGRLRATARSFHIGRRHISDAGRRADGDRLAGAGQPAVLPGQPDRADGRRAAPAVRLPAGPAHGVRGRGPGRRRGPRSTPRSSRPRSSARASARCATSSPPSSPSRTSSSAPTCRRSDLRAGRPGHRQDGGRPAPRGVPALRAPRAADAARACWSSGRTPASCATSATCCRRSARSTPGRPRSRSSSATTLAALQPRSAIRGERRRRRRHAQGRRPDGRGARARAVGARRRDADRGAGACRAGRGGGGSRRTRPRRWSRRCAPAGCGTAPRGRCCRSRSRTGSW